MLKSIIKFKKSIVFVSMLLLVILATSVTRSRDKEINSVSKVAPFVIQQKTTNWESKVSFSHKVEKIDEQFAYIVIKAAIIDGWHVYAVSHKPENADGTGRSFEMKFTPNKNYMLVGTPKDGSKFVTHKDELGTSLYFEKSGLIKQKIKILSKEKFTVDYTFDFQVCDENGCLFPQVLPKVKAAINGAEYSLASNDVPAVIDQANVDSSIVAPTPNVAGAENNVKPKKVINLTAPKENKSLWIQFLLGFVGGLAALFTPCLFPMIPMTVTFFLKQKRVLFNAAIYGFSIIAVYVLIGLIAAIFFNGSSLNMLASNVWMNLIFFIIFMTFAFSFLGAYEITLPNSWINKADENADKGGLMGPVFMAFVLVLVSFSCTGPIVGTLLIEASTGGLIAPIIGMGGFATALALPFTLFAIFPKMLTGLPQSGGWLNSVKVVLGLLEIALALKFLSAADLAYHWDIITREVFIAVWIVVFFIIGIYLLGKIKFSHDSDLKYISVTRFMFALASFVFVVYLIPGMWGAPLKAIDGIAPPVHYSEDDFKFSRGESAVKGSVFENPAFAKYEQFTHDINGGSLKVFKDLKQAEAYAKEVNKPILIDFTGHTCANCRRTESSVWTNEAILPMLQNDMVIVSLYCDDREELPKAEQRFSKTLKGDMINIGNKNSELQIERYKTSQQPLYVIRDAAGNDLTVPIGYTPNIEAYKKFLEKGIKQFK
jgi:thiol:disulfide interchange protein